MTAAARPVRSPRPATPVAAPPRRRARRGEGAALRDELLAAATTVLLETGDAERVSIRAVAAAAGVSPPSVYLHFADRDELVFAVCQDQFQRFDDAVEAATRDLLDGGDPLGALQARAHAYVAFGLAHPEHYRILFMGKPAAAPAGYDSQALMRSAAFQHLIENVEACSAQGCLRPGLDARMVALCLWTQVHGVTSLRISKPDFDWPPAADLVDFAIDAMAFGLADPACAPEACSTTPGR